MSQDLAVTARVALDECPDESVFVCCREQCQPPR
jgi:hypothetical protein